MRKRQKAVRYFYYCGPLPWWQRWPASRVSRYFFTFLIGVLTGVVIVTVSTNHLAGVYADGIETGRLTAVVANMPTTSAGSIP